MASTYREVRVVAIDQVLQSPEETPSNVEFQRYDVNDGLEPYYGSFDIVHVRCIGSGIKSYRTLLEECTRCLKPGGLAIFVEGDLDLFKENQRTIQEPIGDAYPNGSYLQKWIQGMCGARSTITHVPTPARSCPHGSGSQTQHCQFRRFPRNIG